MVNSHASRIILMVTLNQSLHQTSHHSLLMRKAARYGLGDVENLINLAVLRGCHHYRNVLPHSALQDPGQDALSDEELAILLLHGNNRYEPMAIRCAAQLLKSKRIHPERVSHLAIRERCEVPLRYIASHGLIEDVDR